MKRWNSFPWLSRRLFLTAVIGLLALTNPGCKSPGPKKPSSRSMTSIALEGPTTEEIRQASLDVFKEDLWKPVYAGPNNLVFEKRGSWFNDLSYGDWGGADVWIRVKLGIKPYGVQSHLLECDAYMVREHDNAFFEEEQKVLWFKKGPYKKMLARIQAKLDH
jgi:hypothetical protein